jgi:hypothetical protein
MHLPQGVNAVKTLKNFAIIAILVCGQHINAMDSKREIMLQNIDNKIAILSSSVNGALKQMQKQNPAMQLQTISNAFRLVKEDIDRIIRQSDSLLPSDKYKIFNALHDRVTLLYKAYQEWSVKNPAALMEARNVAVAVDDLWMNIVDNLNRLMQS